MIGRRGIGAVVGTVLFTLLAIASVSVLWAVVGNNVKNSAASASRSADCLTLDVVVNSCVLNLTEFEYIPSKVWNIMYLSFDITRGPNSKIRYIDLDFTGINVVPPAQASVLHLNNTYEINALENKKVVERIYAVADLLPNPPYFIPVNPLLWYFSPLFNTFWTPNFGEFYFPVSISPKVILENGVSCPLVPVECTCIDEFPSPIGNGSPWCQTLDLIS
ncbi:MAG: hypothetical protein ACP5NS_00660 [Candidatus Pacearchaeota archaeon]